MMLKLPAEIVQAVHDYLMTRPMQEVETLVVQLRRAVPADAPPSPATVPPEQAQK